VPTRGIQHIDLAVSDLDRSLAFYLDLLEPLGLKEMVRFPTYRGTEDVVYLGSDAAGYTYGWLGLRPADGGEHRYYDVGVEHIAFEVETREEVDEAHRRCVEMNAKVHHPPEEDSDVAGYYALFVFDPDGLRIEVFSQDRGYLPET
jgi:catechol 2,3-dioxygenase-like lactoylglutathione lyase family enzyme